MSLIRDRRLSRREFLRMVAATTATLAFDWTHINAIAAKIGPKEKLPVVVIGGGLGGLSSAAIFARQGFPVTLVEQHDRPGGYATSFDREGRKFTFDVSLHATSGVKRDPMRSVFEEAGILNKVEMVDLPELCRIITPDHDLIWPQRNPDAIINQLCQIFPDQAGGIRGFFAEILGILDEAMKPFDRESWWDKMIFPITHKRMWAIRNETLADVLDKYAQDKKVRSILSVFWGYYGLPPSKLSGFLYAIATASFMRFGGYYVKRRSQDLSYALMEAIEEAGGKVLLETEAVGITVKDEAVSGVKLNDGRTIKAKAVISNASVPATIRMLPQEMVSAHASEKARKYLDKLNTYRPSLSTFIVWLGLNQEIRDKVNGYEIFVEPHYDPEESYQGCLACDPKRTGIGVTIYDNAYPGYSAPGTSTVSILTLSGYEPWRRFEADYFAGRKQAYREEKERITEELINLAEKWV
ncbi:MAG: NAD(P)/FAD-dependent oxidoreductase, partial [Dehalococcoidia bacterium]|nr:NAD(P)/FAD-dependent oxidoreductase [Dehalococcoidia bacterium]